MYAYYNMCDSTSVASFVGLALNVSARRQDRGRFSTRAAHLGGPSLLTVEWFRQDYITCLLVKSLRIRKRLKTGGRRVNYLSLGA